MSAMIGAISWAWALALAFKEATAAFVPPASPKARAPGQLQPNWMHRLEFQLGDSVALARRAHKLAQQNRQPHLITIT
jgi:hypothetical protein